MMLPDVNVLVYAFRKDSPQHTTCNSWLNDLVQSNVRFGISPLALNALARITTDRRIYRNPSRLNEAFAFTDYFFDQPNCEVVEPGERHWDIFKHLCLETNTQGSRISDVWYAALAIERGCEWVTFDRDYARFPGLKWRMPTAA